MPLLGKSDVGKLKDKGNVKGLTRLLTSKDSDVRRQAELALVEIGVPAVGAILKAQLKMSDDRNIEITRLLVSIGAPAVESLIAHVSNPKISYYALHALGGIGDERAADVFLSTLSGGKIRNRMLAAIFAGEVAGERAIEPLIAALAAALEDRTGVELAWVGVPAAKSLGGVGDERAIEPLIAVLRDYNVDLRRNATEALGKICLRLEKASARASAVGPLIHQLSDPDPGVRTYAAKWLGVLGDKRALEPLIAHLDDVDGEVRRAAAMGLGLGAFRDVRAVESLLACLSRADAPVKVGAAFGLGLIRDVRAVGPLIALLDDVDGEVRCAAARALGILGDDRATEPLISKLKDSNLQAIEALTFALQDHDEYVRSAAASALDKIGVA